MITERDEIRCKTSMKIVEDSSLDERTKSDIIESLEEAKLNLNGRTIEERVLSIAQNQFALTRLIAGIIVNQFGREDGKKSEVSKSWKDVIIACRWSFVVLGSIIAVCSIFQPQVIRIFEIFQSLLV